MARRTTPSARTTATTPRTSPRLARPRASPKGEDSPQHGQIPFIEDDLDIAHGELKQHNEEFMETYGHTVMPNVDPPMPITREESTAPPQ